MHKRMHFQEGTEYYSPHVSKKATAPHHFTIVVHITVYLLQFLYSPGEPLLLKVALAVFVIHGMVLGDPKVERGVGAVCLIVGVVTEGHSVQNEPSLQLFQSG